jgi:hypothetical protein
MKEYTSNMEKIRKLNEILTCITCKIENFQILSIFLPHQKFLEIQSQLICGSLLPILLPTKILLIFLKRAKIIFIN